MHVQENGIFLDSPKPRLFWCVFFNQHGRDYERSAKLPKNMFVTRLPGESLGFEESVEEVIKLSKLIFVMSLEIRIYLGSAASKFSDCLDQDSRRRKLDQDYRKTSSSLLHLFLDSLQASCGSMIYSSYISTISRFSRIMQKAVRFD